MVSAQELIVAIRSEGVRETVSDLRGVSDSMDETASATGEAAEKAEGFSTTFKGAVSAAAASLAVASASLLSQVPVIGEAISGLGAVVDAIVRKMDEQLRPAVSGLADDFFDLSEDIDKADGALGDFIGIAAVATAAISALTLAVIGVGAAVGPFLKGLKTIKSVGSTVAGGIRAIGAALLSLPGLFALAGAAILGFFVAYGLGLGDVQQKTDAFAETVRTGFRDFLTNIRQTLLDAKEVAKTRTAEIFDSIGNKINAGAEQARTGFRAFLTNIRETLLDAKELAKTKAKEIGATIVASLLKGFKQAAGLASGPLSTISDALGIDLSLGSLPDFSGVTGGDGGTGDGTGTGTGTGRAGTGSNSGPIATTLDGRSIVESTGRFARDSTARNGGI